MLSQLQTEQMQAAQLKFPEFKAGDALEIKVNTTVLLVHTRKHGLTLSPPLPLSLLIQYTLNKTTQKTQTIRGVVIARANKGLGSNFTIRNVIGGVPVEIQYALYSPLLHDIEVLQRDFIHKGMKRTRRSKLYYLRDKPDAWCTVTHDFAQQQKAVNRSSKAQAAAAAKRKK